MINLKQMADQQKSDGVLDAENSSVEWSYVFPLRDQQLYYNINDAVIHSEDSRWISINVVYRARCGKEKE